eukprot:6492616-Amphidinium_carterae.1
MEGTTGATPQVCDVLVNLMAVCPVKAWTTIMGNLLVLSPCLRSSWLVTLAFRRRDAATAYCQATRGSRTWVGRYG